MLSWWAARRHAAENACSRRRVERLVALYCLSNQRCQRTNSSQWKNSNKLRVEFAIVRGSHIVYIIRPLIGMAQPRHGVHGLGVDSADQNESRSRWCQGREQTRTDDDIERVELTFRRSGQTVVRQADILDWHQSTTSLDDQTVSTASSVPPNQLREARARHVRQAQRVDWIIRTLKLPATYKRYNVGSWQVATLSRTADDLYPFQTFHEHLGNFSSNPANEHAWCSSSTD